PRASFNSYYRYLNDFKVSELDLKDSIKYNLYLEKIILAQVKITDADILNYYEANRDLFRTPELRLVSHIFTVEESDIKKAYAELLRGESFAEVANKYSLDPGTNTEGGLIGYMSKEDDWIGVTETAFLLNEGEFSTPQQSEYGWHLVYVADIRESSDPQFTEIKDKVRQSYVDYLVDNMKASIIQSIKDNSNITINI
ncbi:MAG TPA: hypothetical protein GX522_00090, partial [Firmicutes bacterium]|nr:hypothetical protein [Bacillota bacterium]